LPLAFPGKVFQGNGNIGWNVQDIGWNVHRIQA